MHCLLQLFGTGWQCFFSGTNLLCSWPHNCLRLQHHSLDLDTSHHDMCMLHVIQQCMTHVLASHPTRLSTYLTTVFTTVVTTVCACAAHIHLTWTHPTMTCVSCM